MKVNRIKWNEEMNKRCLKRLGNMQPLQKTNTVKVESRSNNNSQQQHQAETFTDTRAIGVGECIECEVVIGRI